MACSSMIACCTGCKAGAFASFFCFAYHSGKPSSVVTDFPRTADTGVTQERVSASFTSTEHEPHCERPQPNRGPCRCKSPESTYSRGAFGSAATLCLRPLTRIWILSVIQISNCDEIITETPATDSRLASGSVAAARTLQFSEQ